MTPREEFSAMVARIEAELRITPAGYTPRIRELEAFADDVNRQMPRDREALTAAIRTLELEWRTEIARARRTGAQGASR